MTGPRFTRLPLPLPLESFMFKPKKPASKNARRSAPVRPEAQQPGLATTNPLTPEEQDKAWREFQTRRVLTILGWIAGPLILLLACLYAYSAYKARMAAEDLATRQAVLPKVQIGANVTMGDGSFQRFEMDGLGALCVLKPDNGIVGNPNYYFLMPNQTQVNAALLRAAEFKLTRMPSDPLVVEQVQQWLAKCTPAKRGDFAVVNNNYPIASATQPIVAPAIRPVDTLDPDEAGNENIPVQSTDSGEDIPQVVEDTTPTPSAPVIDPNTLTIPVKPQTPAQTPAQSTPPADTAPTDGQQVTPADETTPAAPATGTPPAGRQP